MVDLHETRRARGRVELVVAHHAPRGRVDDVDTCLGDARGGDDPSADGQDVHVHVGRERHERGQRAKREVPVREVERV